MAESYRMNACREVEETSVEKILWSYIGLQICKLNSTNRKRDGIKFEKHSVPGDHFVVNVTIFLQKIEFIIINSFIILVQMSTPKLEGSSNETFTIFLND